jgi:xenotropic and polytropic retrovirus receptor 1
MVHFSVRLRDNAYAEWRGDYLDYKRLKKALKKQRDVDEQLSRAAAQAQALAIESSGSDLETQSMLVTRRSPPSITSVRKTVGSFASSNAEMQSLLLAPVGFEDLLAEQYDKVERAYEKHLSHLGDQLALLRDQSHASASQAARDSVRNTLVELHRLLNHLLNFALLNYTGFVKILKKHDKMFPTQPQLSREHRGKLHAFAFADATQCRSLLSQVELLFADLFCEGNRSVAVASLMTRRDDAIDWAPVYIGIKIGSCLILVVWVVWDSLIVPTFKSGRERHIIDLAVTRAYPVYRGIGCCLLLHWLIGVSMYVWRSARINYRYIFELNPRTTPHYTAIFSDATNMSIVYLVNVLLYYKVVNGYFPEKILHRGYYPLMLFAYTIYFYIVRPWGQQRGLAKTLVEIVGSPFFPVTFFHVFVGDYLTSSVKVNQDLAWSVCFFATKEFLLKDRVPTDPTGHSGVRLFPTSDLQAMESSCQNNVYYVKVIVPLICALPLWWRFLQSLRRIYDTETWWPNLPNAFKYALAQVVALFGLFHPFYSATDASVDVDFIGIGPFQIVWITLFTLSSLYTWVWDVWMDWGLGRPQYKFLGDRQMFSRIWVYYGAFFSPLGSCPAQMILT